MFDMDEGISLPISNIELKLSCNDDAALVCISLPISNIELKPIGRIRSFISGISLPISNIELKHDFADDRVLLRISLPISNIELKQLSGRSRLCSVSVYLYPTLS